MSKLTNKEIEKKAGENPFPVASTDPKLKSKKSFGTAVAKAIYWQGIFRDVTTNRRVIAEENRDYGSNRQDINKFKKLLDASIDNNGDKSHINIDWSIQTPGKKFVDTIVGDIMNQEYKVQFNALDTYSKRLASKARDEYYGKIARERDMKMMEEESGIVLERRGGFMPKSEEEIAIHMDLEFKQDVEIAMEDIVEFELDRNKWKTRVKNRVIRDLVENNVGAVRWYFDRNNQIRLRYVDAPTNFYTSYTDEPDANDVEYEAEKVLLSIRELKRRDTKGEVTEEQWWKIAKEAQDKNRNGAWRFGDAYNAGHTWNGIDYAYDDYRIEVLDFIYYTKDKKVWVEKDDNYGGRHLSRKGANYEKPKRSKKNQEVIEKEIDMSYEGVWVVGHDVLLGYERSKNILRPATGPGKSISPELIKRYITFQPNLRSGTSKSIVDIIKPNLDMIQLLVLRKRHVIAEMTPSGIGVDVNGVTDVLSALGETDPMKIIKLYKQKGVLFFARTDVNGDPANGVPIQELNSPFAEQLIAIDNAILNEIGHIQTNSGINDARDGSSPDSDALVGIEKMRLLASNNATRETYKAFFDGILAPSGEAVARMVQCKVEYGDGIKEYENIISESSVRAIEFVKHLTMAQLGVVIEAIPTDDQIQSLLDMLEISLKAGDIRTEDYLEIKRISNIKKAERLLIYRRKKVAEEKMLEFQQREQITGQREQQAAMTAAEAEKIKQMAKSEAEQLKIREEYRLKKEFNDHETMNELKKIDREAYWKEKMLEMQLEEEDGDGNGVKLGIDKPKIFSNPAGAVSRKPDLNA